MYKPKPINTENVILDEGVVELTEFLAKNTHEVWALERFEQGWSYGEKRDDDKKTNPCLVEYEELPDSEKEYDRKTATETLKVITELGYEIKRK